MTPLWAMGLVLFATFIGSFGPILLKIGSKRITRTSIRDVPSFLKSTIGNLPLVSGISFYALAFVLYVPALHAGDLSVLYPLVSVSYIWVSIMSAVILRERMTTFKWLGVALIIGGAILVGLGS